MFSPQKGGKEGGGEALTARMAEPLPSAQVIFPLSSSYIFCESQPPNFPIPSQHIPTQEHGVNFLLYKNIPDRGIKIELCKLVCIKYFNSAMYRIIIF